MDAGLKHCNFILVFLSHNVPAVCDGFAVAIKEHEVFQQPQNCGGVKHHKGRSPTGVLRNPSRYSGEA
jgi:hypothetical protein